MAGSRGWVEGFMWCVTFTRNVTREEVLARYGGNPDDALVRTLDEARSLNFDSYTRGREASVLRVGQLGGWAFCFEDAGIMGSMDDVLQDLSRGTETFSVLTTGDGLDTFAYWRDGDCVEAFEPGYAYTRGTPPHPWWDAVEERRAATGLEYPGLAPVVQVVADHTGVMLDDATVKGPLLSLPYEDTGQPANPPTPQTPRSAPGVVTFTSGVLTNAEETG